MEVCPRCGSLFHGPCCCSGCWDGRADEHDVAELVSLDAPAGAVPANDALRLLGNIDDRRAAPALRPLVDRSLAAVRLAAVRSLGWSGDSGDVAWLTKALADEELRVRAAARASLANIGGRMAIDALFANVGSLEPLERGDAQPTLAWLGDARDIDAMRELAVDYVRHAYGLAAQGRFLTHHGGGAMMALIAVGDGRDRQMLIDVVLDMHSGVEIENPEQPYLTRPLGHANHSALMLRVALERAGHTSDAERLSDGVAAILAARLPEGVGHASRARPVSGEPLSPRLVPRLAMRELLERPAEGARPPLAKFGGQPDWTDTPTWPIGPDGHPIVFLAQLPTVDRSRTLYVFFADHDGNWETLGNANAVVVQPGAPPQTPIRAAVTGPQLFHRVERPDRYTQPMAAFPYERFIDLAPGADPQRWDWPPLAKGEFLRTPREDCASSAAPRYSSRARTGRRAPDGSSPSSSQPAGRATSSGTLPSATGLSTPTAAAPSSGNATSLGWPGRRTDTLPPRGPVAAAPERTEHRRRAGGRVLQPPPPQAKQHR